MMETRQITSIIITYSLLSLCASASWEPSFSQSHFVVWFDPFVCISNMEVLPNYDTSDVIPLVSKVSTRFNRLMGFPIPDAVKIPYNPAMVPLAVATFNKLHLSPGHPPMELLMTYNPYRGGVYASFDKVKQVADDANAIYPGTVKRIVVFYDRTIQNYSEFEYLLAEAQRLVASSEYILGVDLFLGDCETFENSNKFSKILPFVKEVYLRWLPTQTTLKLGAEMAAISLSNMFVRCVTKIKNINENIFVGFRTQWPSIEGEDDSQNNEKLVTFWKKMNELAVNFNTTVILSEAFDVPIRPEGKKKQGWWKLIQNPSYYNTSQYIFEEKFYVKNEKLTEKGIDVMQIILAAIGVFCTLCTCFGFIIRMFKFARGNSNSPSLTKEEIAEFYEGAVEAVVEGNSLPEIRKTAYKPELELAKDAFTIDFTSTLGSGAFGAVYRGSVFRQRGEVELLVAVKTSKPSCPATTFKGLLTEIKVLSYLGRHANIVGLFGAYTKEIKKGKVYVFLELCLFGSLEKYLREMLPRCDIEKDTKERERDGDDDELAFYRTIEYMSMEYHQNNVETKKCPHARDLYRWSCEILSGMDFLATKKVVHADLATRNVLLTLDKRAKISDFGLSRRLYEYTNYVKTQQEPLPWRWMAPEALRRMEFNEKTDVWSFGVTLWEIYSLGDLPFQGISWSSNFSSQLIKGLRLEEPICNNHNMYSNMLRCWNLDPYKRPTFSELKLMIE